MRLAWSESGAARVTIAKITPKDVPDNVFRKKINGLVAEVNLGVDLMLSIAKGDVVGHTHTNKFGRNADVDAGASETVWRQGGTYVFPTAAQTLSVSSSSANDTSAGTGMRTVTIEGLNGSYAEVSETITLSGTTPVTTSNSYLRVNRAYGATAGTGQVNAGTITANQSTSGITVFTIAASDGQTQQAIYTVPAAKTAYMTRFQGSVDQAGAAASVDLDLRTRVSGVLRIQDHFGLRTDGTSSVNIVYQPYKVFDAQTDIFVRATSSANNVDVHAKFDIILVDD